MSDEQLEETTERLQRALLRAREAEGQVAALREALRGLVEQINCQLSCYDQRGEPVPPDSYRETLCAAEEAKDVLSDTAAALDPAGEGKGDKGEVG